MKKTMLSVLALSSVILLAGCNNTPAEEEVIIDETPEEVVDYVIDDADIDIVPVEEVYVVDEDVVADDEEVAADDYAVEADVIVEAEPVEEVIE